MKKYTERTDFRKQVIHSRFPLFFIEGKTPCPFEEIKIWAACHDFKLKKKDGIISIYPKGAIEQPIINMNIPTYHSYNKYGRRLRPEGAEWEEPEYIVRW